MWLIWPSFQIKNNFQYPGKHFWQRKIFIWCFIYQYYIDIYMSMYSFFNLSTVTWTIQVCGNSIILPNFLLLGILSTYSKRKRSLKQLLRRYVRKCSGRSWISWYMFWQSPTQFLTVVITLFQKNILFKYILRYKTKK